MEKSKYYLQIPITKELETQLKHLAKIDERSLRIFCKKILEDYVKNVSSEVIEDKKDTKVMRVNENPINFDLDSIE